MSKAKNDHTVIAVFPSMDAAKSAASTLHDWTKDNKMQVGDIGYVYMKGDKVKTKRWRKTGKGAKWGLVVGGIAAVLSGGITLIPGLVGGAAAGAVVGAFVHNSLGISKDDVKKLGADLDSGKVAVVVTCPGNESDDITGQLKTEGGDVQSYEVQDQAAVDAAADNADADAVDADTSGDDDDASAPAASSDDSAAAPAASAS